MSTLRSCISILLIGLVAATCAAQERAKVTLSGAVIDPSGAAVSGAKINIKPDCQCSDCADPQSCTCCPNQVAVTTDEQGNFRVSLVPGTYAVKAEVRGYRPREVTVTVTAQAEQHVTIQVE